MRFTELVMQRRSGRSASLSTLLLVDLCAAFPIHAHMLILLFISVAWCTAMIMLLLVPFPIYGGFVNS